VRVPSIRRSEKTLSVVSPYAGGDALAHFLASLEKQLLSTNAWELLIVTEVNEDQVRQNVPNRIAKITRIIRFARPAGFGGHSAGVMRNIGAKNATGRILVFLDSDCIAAPDCLEHHARWHGSGPSSKGVACGGMREFSATSLPLLGGALNFEEAAQSSNQDFRGGTSRKADWQDFYSANVSLLASHFARAGRFDESGFRCHDMDLAYRLKRRGCQFWLLSEAIVVHLEHPRSVRSKLTQAAGWTHLGKKYRSINKLCEKQSQLLVRSYREIRSYAEKQFAHVLRGIRGVRRGTQFTIHHSVPAVLWRRLHGVPHSVHHARDGLLLNLRLHRSCWDYSIVIPTVDDPGPPSITVAVTSFNHAKYIGQAITSVLTQTVQRFELIVIDDASTDDTCAVLSRFAGDRRIRIFTNNANIGLAQCLNKAVELSRAPYIVQLDSDDAFAPTALACILKAFRRDSRVAAVFGSAAQDHSPTLQPVGLIKAESLLSSSEQTAPRAYRIRCIKEIGGWLATDAKNGRFFEDRLMLARIAERFHTTSVDTSLYLVRRTNNSLSTGNPRLSSLAKSSIILNFALSRQRSVALSKAGMTVIPRFAARIRRKPAVEWSIVIPTRDNEHLLAYSLCAWAQASLSASTELIVVDDGSATPVRVKDSPLALTVLRLEKQRGAAAARNAGASAARGRMLMFCDADHIVPPDLLAYHENAHAQAANSGVAVGVVQGRKTPTAFRPGLLDEGTLRRILTLLRFVPEGLLEVFNKSLSMEFVELVTASSGDLHSMASRLSFSDDYLFGWMDVLGEYGPDLAGFPHRWLKVAAGCLSISASLFHSVGRFQQDLRSLEDWELGARLQKAGHTISCIPIAEPLHQVHERDVARARNNHLSYRKLAAKHCDLVRQLLADEQWRALPGRALLARLHGENISGAPEVTRARQIPTRVFLTFDDGPSPNGTALILEVLKAHNAKATFFVLGAEVSRARELCRAMLRDGHEFGVHAWQHAPIDRLSRRELRDSLAATKRVLVENVGATVRFCRPPFGNLNANYRAVSAELGLTPVLWTRSAGDWGTPTSFEIVRNICRLDQDEIVLLHDGCGDPCVTASALSFMISALQQRGIAISKLSQMTLLR
jgi:glycosyltransferase involved in cell wall biosynthesis/peptidoglycan/xylan/chitin deacetylase (PgdA/CDA1 family)